MSREKFYEVEIEIIYNEGELNEFDINEKIEEREKRGKRGEKGKNEKNKITHLYVHTNFEDFSIQDISNYDILFDLGLEGNIISLEILKIYRECKNKPRYILLGEKDNHGKLYIKKFILSLNLKKYTYRCTTKKHIIYVHFYSHEIKLKTLMKKTLNELGENIVKSIKLIKIDKNFNNFCNFFVDLKDEFIFFKKGDWKKIGDIPPPYDEIKR